MQKSTEISAAARAEFLARRRLQESLTSQLTTSGTKRLSTTAQNHRGQAIYSTLLGEDLAASQCFRNSGQDYLALSQELTPPGRMAYCEAIISLLLSNSVEGYNKARELSVSGVPLDDKKHPHPDRALSYVHDRLAFSLGLPLLCADMDSEARKLAEDAQAVESRKAVYPGVGDAMLGIAAKDEARFHSGLKEMLSRHYRQALTKKSPIYALAERYLCIPASALCVVAAQRHGWVVSRDFPGRTADLTISITWAREDLAMKPGETMEVVESIDFLNLPSAL